MTEFIVYSLVMAACTFIAGFALAYLVAEIVHTKSSDYRTGGHND